MKCNRTIGICVALSAVFAFAGCQKDDSHTFENKVFISASSFSDELRVQRDENVTTMSAEVTAGLAEPESEDIEVVFRAAPELLDKYRLAYYDENAQLLPEGHFSAEQMTAVIVAGNMTSSSLEFVFDGLDALDYETNYVYPVTIESASGMGILESARTMYFVIKEASLVNVVADMHENCAWPVWDEFEEVSDLSEFTLEALVNGTAFTNDSYVHTIMGIEDCFLIRVGDTTIPKNQLQIAYARIDEENNTTYRGSVTDAALQLKTDRWYHIAVTFDRGLISVYLDGTLKATGDASGGDINMTSVNFQVPHSDESDGKPRCFWVGYSYDANRSFNGQISEVRLWNRALSPDEINAENHFYKILNPEADASLLAYWKFCDGQGKTVLDYSCYGNDLMAQNDIVWNNVSLPEK
ncbi:MAG: DUF1735 domain-containing protein [Bacteroidetes bacterium]|uniref:DUF1735 domain-containing protein n=1 Tax=Candidatus Cryptobacteroides merdavium TaxID=2840769 RepID=A0A9D9EF28_9BACT|nr:DUF1735 domain-containing protein [Candidatus Cryptobacteroides merdavium]